MDLDSLLNVSCRFSCRKNALLVHKEDTKLLIWTRNWYQKKTISVSSAHARTVLSSPKKLLMKSWFWRIRSCWMLHCFDIYIYIYIYIYFVCHINCVLRRFNVFLQLLHNPNLLSTATDISRCFIYVLNYIKFNDELMNWNIVVWSYTKA